jgi:hypothetical protein
MRADGIFDLFQQDERLVIVGEVFLSAAKNWKTLEAFCIAEMAAFSLMNMNEWLDVVMDLKYSFVSQPTTVSWPPFIDVPGLV